MKRSLTILFVLISATLFSQITYTYGSYTGTGAAQNITGVGFQPDAIIIKSESTHEAYLFIEGMDAGEAKAMGTTAIACETGKITAIGADGFSVGTDSETNNNTTTYHFVCWQEGGDLSIGTYTGNGTGTGNSENTCGFDPEVVIICGDQAEVSGDVGICLATLGWGSSEGLYTRAATRTATADFVASSTATGFTQGNGADSPDDSGVTYYYMAFNESGNTTVQNTYGDGSNAVDGETIAITGTSSFQPDFMFVMCNTGPEQGIFRSASMNNASDMSYYFDATATLTNRIQSFQATGIEAGTNNEVNRAWNTNQMHYFASSGGSALPVELLSFNGMLKDGEIKLEWVTGMEVNSSHFVVLKSTDGEIFNDITDVQAAGNSTSQINYSWIDPNPVPGKNYYRLKQVDNNGVYEVFKTIIINYSTGEYMVTVNVFPNPVEDRANVYFETKEGGIFDVQVFSQLGQKVYESKVFANEGSNNIEINTIMFEAGLYILKIKGPNKVHKQLKFYKKN